MENNLDSFKTQEIELTIEDMVLKLKKLKKKELAFLSKRNKRFKKKTTMDQLVRTWMETEKWISLIKKIKDKEDEEKTEVYLKAFNDYLEIKNSLIYYLPILEILDIKIDEACKKMEKRMSEGERTYFQVKKLLVEYGKVSIKHKRAFDGRYEADADARHLEAMYQKRELEKLAKDAWHYMEKTRTHSSWKRKRNKANQNYLKMNDKFLKAKCKSEKLSSIYYLRKISLKTCEEENPTWSKIIADWEEFKESCKIRKKLLVKIEVIIQKKQNIKNLLTYNKVRLKEVLEIFGEPCIGIVPETIKEEGTDTQEDSIFCPHCGLKIEISRLN